MSNRSRAGQHRPAVRGCSSLQGFAEMPPGFQGQGRNEGILVAIWGPGRCGAVPFEEGSSFRITLKSIISASGLSLHKEQRQGSRGCLGTKLRRLHIQILALSCSKSPRSMKKAHTAMTSTSRKALQGPMHTQSHSWVLSLASRSDGTKPHEAPGQGPAGFWGLKSPHSAPPMPQAKTDLCFS